MGNLFSGGGARAAGLIYDNVGFMAMTSESLLG